MHASTARTSQKNPSPNRCPGGGSDGCATVLVWQAAVVAGVASPVLFAGRSEDATFGGV